MHTNIRVTTLVPSPAGTVALLETPTTTPPLSASNRPSSANSVATTCTRAIRLQAPRRRPRPPPTKAEVPIIADPKTPRPHQPKSSRPHRSDRAPIPAQRDTVPANDLARRPRDTIATLPASRSAPLPDLVPRPRCPGRRVVPVSTELCTG